MSNYNPADESWLEWMTVFKRLATLRGQGEIAGTIRELDDCLATADAFPDLRSDALGFRARLHEALGDLERARQDLLSAHALLSSSAGFSRYTLELSLGDICERLTELEEAKVWYLKSLLTLTEDPATSGGAVLRRLAVLVGADGLTEAERELGGRIASQSWRLLGIPGEPDLSDIRKVGETLLDAEAHRF